VVVVPAHVKLGGTDRFKLLVFRILAELLQNGLKHSGAGRLQIAFQQTDDEFVLTYEDDGVGFDLATVYGRGVGLLLLDVYVRALSGQMQILSAVGDGTHVSLHFPLSVHGAPDGEESGTAVSVPDELTTVMSAPDGSPNDRLTVAVLCDNLVFRVGLEQMLRSEERLNFDFVEMLSTVAVLRQSLIPLDVLLVDSAMLSQQVLQLLSKVVAEQTHLRVLVGANPYTLSYGTYLINFGLHGVVGYGGEWG